VRIREDDGSSDVSRKTVALANAGAPFVCVALKREIIDQECNKYADAGQAEHQHGAGGAILGDANRIMALGVQAIERRFQGAVEQFCCEHHAAHDQQESPPHHGGPAPRQYRQHAQGRAALIAKARFAAPGRHDAVDGEAEATVERLVFHARVNIAMVETEDGERAMA
jgi:hypothetical protein